MRQLRRAILVASIATFLIFTLVATPLWAEVPPAKPYGELVEEVMAFLYSDVGIGGIRTNDDDPDGYAVPPYFYHFAIFDTNRLWSSTAVYPWHRSISYPGFTASVAIDAFLDYYRYSGDPEAITRAQAFADWIIEHRTPAEDLYAHCPYSTQTEGVMGGGWDGDAIMTDKPAMFALRCLRLHDITGADEYLEVAQQIADVLATNQLRGGPEDHGRWPFRVRPADGVVRHDYTSHLQPAVRLLDALVERSGKLTYSQARDRAWQWLLANPCNPDSPRYQRWEAFYEDQDSLMQTGKRDHYSAHEMIAELITRRPPGWEQMAADILEWSAANFLLDEPDQGLGEYIPATLEWEGWMEPTFAASLQFARTALWLHQALEGHPLQNPQWEQWAYGMAAACSHGQNQRGIAADGRMYTTLRDITQQFTNRGWYEQNFNTVKYYLELMALDPSLAPPDEHHMLWSEQTIRSILYPPAAAGVVYSVAGGSGRERLRLADAPGEVLAAGMPLPVLAEPTSPGPGWHWDAQTGVLTVNHSDDPVEIHFPLSGVDADRAGATPGPPGAREPQLILAVNSSTGTAGARARLVLTSTQPGAVSVVVYDLRGRHVRTLLASTYLSAGTTEIGWDGRDDRQRRVASGSYYVRAERAGHVACLRLVVAR